MENLFCFGKCSRHNCNDVIKFASTLEKQEASTTGPKQKQHLVI